MTAGHSAAASVIIAAYNAEDTLGAQLEALSRERLDQPFEVLVCDNGSTDGTAALVQQLAASVLPELRLIDASARRGPGAARNIGAEHAVGEVLLFCDADDLIAPGWLQALSSAAAEADLVAGALEGRALNSSHRAAVAWEVSSEITMPWWPRYPAGASSNLAVRAEVFRAIGGFDESLRTGEDIDLCWRVQIAGYSFARSASAVVHSRQRDGRRAVFDQAFSYGAGHRALRFKYQHLIAADAQESQPGPSASDQPLHGAPATDSAGSETSEVHRPLGSRLRRAAFTPSGQATVAWRLGEWLGGRFGRIDPGVKQVDGP